MFLAFMKFLILGLGLLDTNLAFASPTCKGFYATLPQKPITERLREYSETKPGQSPLIIIDGFLAKEIEFIQSRYDHQTTLLQRVGTESRLQSRMNVFETTASAAEKALQELDALIEPDAPVLVAPTKKWYSYFERKQKPMPSKSFEQEIARFRVCRSNMEQCSADLRGAIIEAGKNTVQIDQLVADLESFSRQLEELRGSLQSHPDSIFFSMVIDRKVTSIDSKIKIMKDNAMLEKTRLVTAMVNAFEQAPLFTEQAEQLLARIGESIKDPIITEKVDAKKSAQIETPAKEINGVFYKVLGLSSNIERFEFIRNLSNTHRYDTFKVFSAAEALEILERGDLKNEKSKIKIFSGDFLIWSEGHEVVDLAMGPFMASYLLRITRPSANAKVNDSLYATAAELLALSPSMEGSLFVPHAGEAVSIEKKIRQSIQKSFQPFYQSKK